MFHIEWNEVAISALTDAWMIADSNLRPEITDTIRGIEGILKRDPSTAGESRRPGTRVIVAYPLTVTFHVNVRTNVVLVSDVRVHKRRDE